MAIQKARTIVVCDSSERAIATLETPPGTDRVYLRFDQGKVVKAGDVVSIELTEEELLRLSAVLAFEVARLCWTMPERAK